MKSPFHRPTRLILLKPGGHSGVLPPFGSGTARARRPTGSEQGKGSGRMAVLGLLAGALSLISGCVWGFCRWLGLRGKGHGPITIEKSLTQ